MPLTFPMVAGAQLRTPVICSGSSVSILSVRSLLVPSINSRSPSGDVVYPKHEVIDLNLDGAYFPVYTPRCDDLDTHPEKTHPWKARAGYSKKSDFSHH